MNAVAEKDSEGPYQVQLLYTVPGRIGQIRSKADSRDNLVS